ncbi:ABC-F family ATP-binding cassette domain-containing protein [Bacillus infantis]|uniref:ribosomal protection-like ABC-F family protein n=1 Tax=Bacillus infantis TaxID=324767 RepID=UPI001CD521DF|nr:ABC-F family ATP-binding cassette domain-containing protein [Bacillus infantis]MCA1035886.1 ABC-F family ATP-binding cassette domain-containing protein [Bacillus infantis]
MLELKLNGIKKYMEATLIMRNVSLEAFEGEKIGIVGANGCGKSTILKLIAGIEKMHYYPGYPQTSSPGYDEGLIHFPRGASKAYLEQSPVFPPGLTVNDVLNLAFEEIDEIEARMRELEEQMKVLTDKELEKALNQYSDLVMQLEAKGGYEREEKLGKVCTGLKFSESFLNTDFDLLSGGEKTTVVLGKLLIHNPDILLLDEPTNHLDMEAIEWLEGYLKSCRGIVLIVSHDRYFLDRTVTKIVEIEDMESITYKGNYSSFISQKEENMRIQYEHFREQQKKINGMEKTVSDLREWAMRADNNKFFRRAASIQKKLDKMDIIEKPVFKRRNMRLDIKAAQRSGKEVIKADGLCKSFNDKVIFKNSVLLVQYGERVGLLGSNGSGKTTFLKMLLGEVLPDGGTVELGANVQAAYLPQKIVFNDEELTVLEAFREDISIVEGKAREYLAKFMFYKKSVFTKVKQLSGGERIRLKLAMLLYQDINLLILDEPTNHLDIPSIETLEAALEDFEGTIFFISHDRYFINRISERVVAVEDYSLKNYPGNYDSYKMIKEQKAVQVMPVPEEKKKNQHSYPKQDTSAEKAEARIQRLEQELKEIDAFMAEAGSDYDRLNLLYGRKEKLNKELEEAIGLWLG